jgi:hypothetical protein
VAAAELRLQRGEEGLDRRAHAGVVGLLVIGPVGLRVVGLEPLVELERLVGETGELRRGTHRATMAQPDSGTTVA